MLHPRIRVKSKNRMILLHLVEYVTKTGVLVQISIGYPRVSRGCEHRRRTFTLHDSREGGSSGLFPRSSEAEVESATCNMGRKAQKGFYTEKP